MRKIGCFIHIYPIGPLPRDGVGWLGGGCVGEVSLRGGSLVCTGWFYLEKIPPRGYRMSDRAVFDVIQILADLMPLAELFSIKFGVRLIDPSLLVNRIWREYY